MVFNITIKHWHAVAEWTWSEGDDDMCGICRNAHDGCAPDVKYPGDDSPVVWGACGHAFHLQCIQKWLASNTEQRCPMCRRPWQYKGDVEVDEEGEELPSSQDETEEPDEQQQEYEEEVTGEELDEAEGELEEAEAHGDPSFDPRRLTSTSTLASQDEGPSAEEGGGHGLFGFLRGPGYGDLPQPMRWEGSDGGAGSTNPGSQAHPTPLSGGYGARPVFQGAGSGAPVPRFDLGFEDFDPSPGTSGHAPGFHPR